MHTWGVVTRIVSVSVKQNLRGECGTGNDWTKKQGPFQRRLQDGRKIKHMP